MNVDSSPVNTEQQPNTSEQEWIYMSVLKDGREFDLVTELLGSKPFDSSDKIAIYCGDRRITYGELNTNINRFANVLKELGIEAGDRVLIVAPDTPEFVYSFLGSMRHGACPVPVNTMLTEDDYYYLLNDSGARLLVTTSGSLASKVEPASGVIKKIFLDQDFDHMLQTASSQPRQFPKKPDEIAFWLYSSGSTGKPKGTQHKQISMLHTADSYAKNILQISAKDICFSVSKMFFAYGLGNSISFPFRFGASTVLLSTPPTPESVMETILTFKPSLFFGVPTQYNSVLKKMNGAKFDSIRYCVSAGEALPPEVWNKWREKTGLEILDGIGSTEALHIFISNRPGEALPGSSGKLVPGYEAMIVDDDGKPALPGDTGHLIIRGESLTKGYWNKPEENASRIMSDGWFRTGDMYSLRDGYFVYEGRGDDMLKAGGLWVSPMEIEHKLMEHESIHECAVVGHEVEGLVKPFAYAVLNEGWDKKPQEELEKILMEFLSDKLPKFKRPWGIRFVQDLPKTATGKIQRFKLRIKTT